MDSIMNIFVFSLLIIFAILISLPIFIAFMLYSFIYVSCWLNQIKFKIFFPTKYKNNELTLYILYSYKDGKKVVTKFPNISVRVSQYYCDENGELDGVYICYDSYGYNTVKMITNYKKGVIHGKCTKYDIDLILSENYYENGLKHGIQKEYTINNLIERNSVLILENNYRIGKLHGKCYEYVYIHNGHYDHKVKPNKIIVKTFHDGILMYKETIK